MFWEAEVICFLRRINDTICALLQCCLKLYKVSDMQLLVLAYTDERYYLGWLGGKLMGKLFVVRYEMCNVDIAVVLLHEYILPYLIPVEYVSNSWQLPYRSLPVYEDVVKTELQDKLTELVLNMGS